MNPLRTRYGHAVGMTTAQTKALEIALRDGAVFAGRSEHKGSAFTVSASTLRALERQGKLTLSIGPDGGMMGRLPR